MLTTSLACRIEPVLNQFRIQFNPSSRVALAEPNTRDGLSCSLLALAHKTRGLGGPAKFQFAFILALGVRLFFNQPNLWIGPV